MKNYCKKKIEKVNIKRDCIECKYSEKCLLKKFEERQQELQF